MTLPYTPEFLEVLRRRYEQTNEPLTAIGAEFGLDPETVSRIARRAGWRMRSTMRGLPEHVRLAEAARKAVTENQEIRHARACPGHPRLESGNKVDVDGRDSALRAGPAMTEVEAPLSELPALDRVEQLVLKEIALEEARQTELSAALRRPAEAAHKARTLSTLLQTLQAIERARNGDSAPPAGNPDDNSDDMPRDIDAFRRELARRIDAFVASRADAAHAAGSGEPGMVEEA